MRLTAIAILALAATAARADWEGDLEMKDARMMHKGPPPTGKLRFHHDGKMRMDMQMGPMQFATIVDFKERKSFLINEASKSYNEMPLGGGMGPGSNVPHCDSASFEACMKKQGFKKTGTGEANGQACSIWEGERKGPRGPNHEKLWHPDAAGDEFAMVRVEHTMGEHKSEMNVLNWKMADQDPSQFQVPEGYSKSEGMPGMMMGPPSMKNFHPRPGGPTGGETKEKDE